MRHSRLTKPISITAALTNAHPAAESQHQSAVGWGRAHEITLERTIQKTISNIVPGSAAGLTGGAR